MDENMKNEEGGGLWEFIKVVAISVAIVIPFRTYIAQPFIVSGSSMEPNFHNREYLIIDELSYQLKAPKRGEVIVFRYPVQPSEFFIKRIIGLPGETVEISSGKVLIKNADGSTMALEEPYLPASIKTGPDVSLTLGNNEYFVMGDNREHSSDSRFWGALPQNKIMGRALLRLLPIAKAKIF